DVRPPRFVDGRRVGEGDAGQCEAEGWPRLSGEPLGAATPGYTTMAGSAAAGEGPLAASRAATLVPGAAMVQEVRVPVTGDLAVEVSETFSLTVTPTGASSNGASGASGTATILDDDAGAGVMPVLSVSAAEVVETDGASGRVMQFV